MRPDSAPRTVVVKPCCIGDCVMALPAIDALASVAEGGAVDVFSGAHSMAVFENRPTVRSVAQCPDVFSATSAFRFGIGALRSTRAVRIVAFDRSRWLKVGLNVSGVPERHSLAYDPEEARHESDVCLEVAESLGAVIVSRLPTITVPEDSSGRARALVDSFGPYAVIHSGGGSNPGIQMPQKHWPVGRFAEVARSLRDRGLEVVFTGSANERARASEVAAKAGVDESHVIAGQCDLMTTAGVIRDARLYVGGDTGVSHIAAAVSTPTVAIFGPTNPRRYAPRGLAVAVVAPSESWDVPEMDLRLLSKGPMVSTEQVSVEQVLSACSRLLDVAASATASEC